MDIDVPIIHMPLFKPYRFNIAWGGRDSAKSTSVALALLTFGIKQKHRILCTRFIQRSIKDSAHKLLSDLIYDRNLPYKVIQDSIICPYNGTEFIFKGLYTNKDEIKSYEGLTICWVEEAMSVKEDAFYILLPTLRKQDAFFYFTYNRKFDDDPVHEMFVKNFTLNRPEDTQIIYSTYLDNPFCSQTIIDEANYLKETNISLYNHIYMGEPLKDNKLALWSIAKLRYYDDPPILKRSIIAIDPAVSTEKGSDETGIIVCGQGSDDNFYVIEDLSGRYKPIEWARIVINAYHRYKADRVVAEKNQGGDLVEMNLRTVNKYISYKAVTATKGKYIRAEPIASLYEQGLVYHSRHNKLAQLEHQMVNFTVDVDRKKDGSPDRVDALVWGLTALKDSMVKVTAYC